MQVYWCFYKFSFVLLCVFLSACQSTGRTPWEGSKVQRPAQQAPNTLTRAQVPQSPRIQPTTQRVQNSASYDYTTQRTPNIQNQGYYAQNSYPIDRSFEQQQNRRTLEQAVNKQLPADYGIEQTDIAQTSLTAPRFQSSKAKVALLLPLSGEHQNVGESLLQAAQMALFDLGAQDLELLPRDTKGTAEGAREAASQAVRDGAELVLGPVFASSVKAAKPVISRAGVNMIVFSTDWSNANSKTFIMGVLPFTQVNRVTDFIAEQGFSRYGIIAPRTQYGNVVAESFERRVKRNFGEITKTERYSPLDPNISPLVREFADFDTRAALKQEREQELLEKLAVDPEDEIAKTEMENLEKIQTLGELPYEVVMVPVGGEEAKTLVNLLRFYDVDQEQVHLVGTGLWDDAGLAKEPAMQGSYFAAPSPQSRDFFDKKYRDVYDSFPPRIASIAYDATALSIVLARSNPYAINKFSKEAITNPNGFAGIDGIFRFDEKGLVERGLAVLQIQNGNIKTVDPAPTTFQTADN